MEDLGKQEEHRSIWTMDCGGTLSEDAKEVYFISIIDILTTYSYKKMGENLAKSLFNDPAQISAIRPAPYRQRFQKYVAR
jgi:hypothetical protein